MPSASQYDAIAEQYRRSKSSPLRSYIEAYTFLNLIGDVRGKRILDLACGEGFYSRRLKALGAARVTGVDISVEMIRLAEQQERNDPLGIDFVCADVRELGDLGEFDLIVAAYLLHYAPSDTDLARMCRNIKRHLSVTGRFVTLNENPDQSAEQYAGYEQYGFNKTIDSPAIDGAQITYFMVAGRELFKFHAHYYARQTYEQVLTDAGFGRVAWHPLRLDPAGIDAHGADYWQEYLDNPPVIGLECRV
ncbi:MAG: class I SAM-dependent methyltransferase [Gammaproteobacteria bacterium]|jgi:SAM-dependent methyltransferase|nr:SAM-dependent methyltransferase [Chromatiales bacterium]MCP4925309.1 class I SAM-dependent methyltransferase [Gammaproteobacteria bacterium]MDP7153186.1 class I SAM-dependent methyltransferase [Gammaproteobacteria bacterium]MDP7297177.1 class I SAM-dependent methyltransferase [Gammaproteobacteria bacterium]MDP7418611.1 class I SAM-dependent methyltransferase [Gammaproteobacteria bacterium]